MNIRSIKNRALEVLDTNKQSFIRVLIILLVLDVIPSLFTASNAFIRIIRFALMIVFLTVSHGKVVSSLKMVRNNASEVKDEDAFVGFKRIQELFPTYFVTTVVEIAIIFVATLVIGVISAILFGDILVSIFNTIAYSQSESAIAYALLSAGSSIIFVMLFFVIVGAIIGLIASAYLFPVPYVLEQYHITGFDAVKTSVRMMKGHVFDYIKLFFSFFGWMLLIGFVEAILMRFIGNSLIISIITGIIAIYTYMPHYTLSMTVLFEEISYYYFNQVGE